MDLFRYGKQHTPDSVGRCRGQTGPRNLVWFIFIGWVISYANKWDDYSNYFWEGVELSRIWAIMPTPWCFNSALELSWHFWACHFTCWLRIKVSSCLPLWFRLILIGLCCILGQCHSFKSCALPLSLLLQFQWNKWWENWIINPSWLLRKEVFHDNQHSTSFAKVQTAPLLSWVNSLAIVH